MHKIHPFFCTVFTKSYQLTLILLALSWNVTVSLWTEFGLELGNIKRVLLGWRCWFQLQGSSDVSQWFVYKSLLSLLNYLEQITHMLKQSYHTHYGVSSSALTAVALSEESSKQYFTPLSSQLLLLTLQLFYPKVLDWYLSPGPLIASSPFLTSPVAPTSIKWLHHRLP